MTRILKDFACDESGVTAIEYGLIAALVAVAVAVAVDGKDRVGERTVAL